MDVFLIWILLSCGREEPRLDIFCLATGKEMESREQERYLYLCLWDGRGIKTTTIISPFFLSFSFSHSLWPQEEIVAMRKIM